MTEDIKKHLEKRIEEFKEGYAKVSERLDQLEKEESKIYEEKTRLYTELERIRGSYLEAKNTLSMVSTDNPDKLEEIGEGEEKETEE